jgi:hypothetical protein
MPRRFPQGWHLNLGVYAIEENFSKTKGIVESAVLGLLLGGVSGSMLRA